MPEKTKTTNQDLTPIDYRLDREQRYRFIQQKPESRNIPTTFCNASSKVYHAIGAIERITISSLFSLPSEKGNPFTSCKLIQKTGAIQKHDRTVWNTHSTITQIFA